MNCSGCGKEISPAAKFCKYCGSPVFETGGKGEISSRGISLQGELKESPLAAVSIATVALVWCVVTAVFVKGTTLNTDIMNVVSLSELRGSGMLMAVYLWPTVLICSVVVALFSQFILWQKNDIVKDKKVKMALVMKIAGVIGITANIAMVIDLMSAKRVAVPSLVANLSVVLVFFLTNILFIWNKQNLKFSQIGVLIQSIILILASVRGAMIGDLGFFITGNGFTLPFSSSGWALVSPLDSTLYFMIRLVFGILGMFGIVVFIKSILRKNN